MREIDVSKIKKEVARLCIEANKVLPQDLCDCINRGFENETDNLPKSIMGDIKDNITAALRLDIPVCQDTGMAVVFAEVGQDVHFFGGGFEQAINDGVAEGYVSGLLRCSVVGDPLRRVNTGNNTPAVLHTRIVEGDSVKITVAPKGFGSENMSAMRMFKPTADVEDICSFVVETVKNAGGNPCPPLVIGVGIGGDFEQCALLAKTALCRPVSEKNRDEFYAELEVKMLDAVNETNVGPQGFTGKTTCLALMIEQAPTHIAGLPVAVNIGCHVTRHASIVI